MADGQARYLRNNSTTPEVLLWNQLKQDQFGFQLRRQFRLGPYILDLYCPALKLAVEIDGNIHFIKEESDNDRDAYLASKYVTVVRIPARQIYRDANAVAMRLQSICESLAKGDSPPSELMD